MDILKSVLAVCNIGVERDHSLVLNARAEQLVEVR